MSRKSKVECVVKECLRKFREDVREEDGIEKKVKSGTVLTSKHTNYVIKRRGRSIVRGTLVPDGGENEH